MLGLPKVAGWGLGMDLGFEMTYNPQNVSCGFRSRRVNPSVCNGPGYLYRLGVSLLDLGAVRYTHGNYAFQAQHNGSDASMPDQLSSANSFSSVNDSMSQVTSLTPQTGKYTSSLPTTALIDIDYYLGNGFYVNGQGHVNLTHEAWTKKRVETPSTLTVTPRFDNSWAGVYAPISINQYGQVEYGAGFRLGPVFAGTQNLGALFQNHVQQAGFYVGIKAMHLCRSKTGRVKCPSI